jgi:hypothetical protein
MGATAAFPLTVFGLRAVDHSVVFVRTSPFDPPDDLVQVQDIGNTLKAKAGVKGR